MEFTQAEAKEKEMKRQWVCTRDNFFLEEYGIPAARHGQVVYAHCLERSSVAPPEEVWVVNICFYPGHVLVENLSKEQYEAAFLVEYDVRGR